MMVLYEYYGNTIMAEPINNRTTVENFRAFQAMEHKYIASGLKPRLMRLDNEASRLLNNYLYEPYISFQLVPACSHHHNTV
jgi:hypothetical protein